MEARRDEMVAIVQQWLNDTYGKYESSGRFNTIEVNGKTGWPTIYALRRALQIELGIEQTSDAFGPTTYSKCPSVNQGSEGNIVYIIQGGLWCKGYSPGGFTGYYGNGTYAAVKNLKADMGFPTASGNMNRDVMRGLLDMSAFTLLPGGREEIREIQQKLNYEYYDFYQICPCNGLYDRDMNKMLMYALQKEEGISASQATGAWGPTTIERCPTLSLGDSNVFVTLIKYAVVCNGYSINTSSSVYDAELEATTKDFANSLLIEKAPNKIGYSIIRSLLSSNGDTSRSAKGCDTSTRLDQEKIETLKKHGYEIVGRYLTNVENGTLDKKMTRSEVELILKNGLSIFPIFQEYGASNSAFNQEQGYIQAKKAIQAASNLGIPEETTIYFAVDYDPQESEIINYVYPYFQGINLYFAQSNKEYNIGVYGTRNVCRILKQYESSAFRIDNLFVSDASYGFSGNLGFTMPDSWAFDQFATDITIGEGSGKISIDKVAVSGQDLGFNKLTSLIEAIGEDKLLAFAGNNGILKDCNLEFEAFNVREYITTLSLLPLVTVEGEVSLTESLIGGPYNIDLSKEPDKIAQDLLDNLANIKISNDINKANLSLTLSSLKMEDNFDKNIKFIKEISGNKIILTLESSTEFIYDDSTTTLYQRIIVTIDPKFNTLRSLRVPVMDSTPINQWDPMKENVFYKPVIALVGLGLITAAIGGVLVGGGGAAGAASLLVLPMLLKSLSDDKED